MMKVNTVVFVLLLAAVTLARKEHCVERRGESLVVNPLSNSTNPIAWGHYDRNMLNTGWNELKITTSSDFSDEEQAYAAGYFEGFMTIDDIINFYKNTIAPITVNEQIRGYMVAHAKWVTAEVAANKNATSPDPYWTQVGLMWQQLSGMLDGINKAQSQNGAEQWDLTRLLIVSSQGDLMDLQLAFPGTGRTAPDWRKMKKHDFEMWVAKNTHCSALIKVTDDLSNIFYGHSTWQFFTFATRIYKMLTLNYASSPVKTIEFSSYPTALASTDDFHVVDNGMVVIETSLSVFNYTIYNGNVVPNTLLSWMRVMVANRLATGGEQWAQIFSKHNSGTYNNQWIILNLALFKPKEDLAPNLLWIIEQMPGKIASADMTSTLQYGYWPSYNVPSFKEIFAYSGYPEAVAQQGHMMLDYQKCARAQIFRQQQTSVNSIETMKHMMQYNDFMVDPISMDNPLYAIASRVDLTPSFIGKAQDFGAIDSKVSDYVNFKAGMIVHAFSGPTPQQKDFCFSTTNASVTMPHNGLPDKFDFKWEVFQP